MSDTYTTRYTLLKRAKNQHDAKAWEEFINTYKNYIYIIVRSMNVNKDDTQDIIQQVVIKLWKALPTYILAPEKHKFRNWISRITRNEVISFIRRQRTRIQKLDEATQDATLSYLDSVQLPEVDYIAENEWQLFITNTAMKRLESYFPAHAIKAFKLHSQGTPISEITAAIGVKKRTVYKYISRTKSQLIDEVEQLKKEFLI